MDMDTRTLSYEDTLKAGAAEYRDVLETLNAAGLPTVFTQTGGMCAALEVQLETGMTLLLTDAGDPLSWQRSQQRGWGVGMYRTGAVDDGPTAYSETESVDTAALMSLVDDVLMQRDSTSTRI